MEQFWRDLFLSFTMHVLFLALLMLAPALPKPEAPITFEVIPKQDILKQQQVIRNAHIDNSLKQEESEDPLKFLSEKVQRVKQQMKAARSGLTTNRNANSSQPTQPTQASSPQHNRQHQIDSDGLEKFLPNKPLIPRAKDMAEHNPQGYSTLSEDIPTDVKLGDITALNTDRYLYYSYFARAQELIWNEWSPRIQATLENPPPSLRSNPNTHFTTLVEVWFYPDGRVHSTHIFKPSGISQFDYIAESSFQRIRLIPNPPKEKIDGDGLIRFKWNLTVEYDPKVLVRQ